uniref:Amidase domain-containing protein n=1 Tax=Echinostoma caproni TaxID=27848 RepID=A0A183BFZ4_9TREM
LPHTWCSFRDDAAVQYVLGAVESLFTEAGVSRDFPVVDARVLPSLEAPEEETPQPGPSITGPVREVREVLPNMDIDLIQVSSPVLFPNEVSYSPLVDTNHFSSFIRRKSKREEIFFRYIASGIYPHSSISH